MQLYLQVFNSANERMMGSEVDDPESTFCNLALCVFRDRSLGSAKPFLFSVLPPMFGCRICVYSLMQTTAFIIAIKDLQGAVFSVESGSPKNSSDLHS